MTEKDASHFDEHVAFPWSNVMFVTSDCLKDIHSDNT
jgi:hypothetical protein